MEQLTYDIAKVHEALLYAFTADELTQMTHLRLHVRLPDISSESKPFRHRVFELVSWAENHNRLNDLVAGAYAENPDNPLLRNLVHPPKDSTQPYLSTRAVAASSQGDTAALVGRIVEWKDLHHHVQELLLAIFDTDRLMNDLGTPLASPQAKIKATEELDRIWITDTSRKVGALKAQVSSFSLIRHEPVVVDVLEILTRTGKRSLAIRLFGLNGNDPTALSKSSILVLELQGVLIDALRASDEWIRRLIGELSIRMSIGESK